MFLPPRKYRSRQSSPEAFRSNRTRAGVRANAYSREEGLQLPYVGLGVATCRREVKSTLPQGLPLVRVGD
jgi:hypothetical protein